MRQQRRKREEEAEADEAKAENDQEKIENRSVEEIEREDRSRSLNRIFREEDEISADKSERIATLVRRS
jgi:hypothetical protein